MSPRPSLAPVRDPVQMAGLVRDTVATLWPRRFEPEHLTDDAPLDGLGLDSIDVVELLLACEDRLGVTTSSSRREALFAAPVTLQRLVDHLAAA